MANIIDFSKDTKTVNSSTSSISSETQTTKDKPSLFDSLLTNTPNEETVEIATQDSKNVEIKIEEVSVEIEDNVKEEIKSTSSLLDRLIIEAKKDVKTVNEKEIKSLDSKTAVLKSVEIKIPNLEVPETQETVETPTVDVNEEVLKIQENKSVEVPETQETVEIPNVDVKEEIKSTSSLLDRLIIEAKKDVKIVSEEELKNLGVKTDVSLGIKEEIKTVETPSVEIIQNRIETPNEETVEIATQDSKNVEIKIEEVSVEIVNNQSAEAISILTNNITTETKDNSSNKNVDIKLNVLSEVLSSPVATKTSLMDQLIQKNIGSGEIIISPEQIDLVQKENISKDFISNIYLGTQKNSINNQELFNKNEAINLLKDASSLNDVKTSAGMLELGLENINVDIEESLDLTTKIDMNKKLDLDLVTRRNLIDNLILQKNINSEDIKGLITKSVEASSALLENNLNLADDTTVNVNSPISYNIQSKIIGARQQMSSMMSDIAKQMYENYKPPVTVFKINLNPLELGSISILMKSDKNNALSISMNVSNNSTLDALIENQTVLRNSLNKTFDENTKFNLDFSSSNQNNNQSNNQNNQGSQNRFEQQIDTQSVLQLKEENKDREEKSIDYM